MTPISTINYLLSPIQGKRKIACCETCVRTKVLSKVSPSGTDYKIDTFELEQEVYDAGWLKDSNNYWICPECQEKGLKVE